jgi:hypothetical protein
MNKDIPVADVRCAIGPDETEAAVSVVLDHYPALFLAAGSGVG